MTFHLPASFAYVGLLFACVGFSKQHVQCTHSPIQGNPSVGKPVHCDFCAYIAQIRSVFVLRELKKKFIQCGGFLAGMSAAFLLTAHTSRELVLPFSRQSILTKWQWAMSMSMFFENVQGQCQCQCRQCGFGHNGLCQWQCTMYSVHGVMSNVQCTIHNCTVQIVQLAQMYNSTMYNVQCITCNVQCTMYSVQCTMYNVQYIMYNVKSIINAKCSNLVSSCQLWYQQTGFYGVYYVQRGNAPSLGYLQCSPKTKYFICSFTFAFSNLIAFLVTPSIGDG